jgi:arginyl-tRNA synthetase
LLIKLSQFSENALKAFTHLNPSIVATYCYQLCQKFNEFYQNCPVIKSEHSMFRLALVESFRQILRNALRLLGIEVVEEM